MHMHTAGASALLKKLDLAHMQYITAGICYSFYQVSSDSRVNRDYISNKITVLMIGNLSCHNHKKDAFCPMQ